MNVPGKTKRLRPASPIGAGILYSFIVMMVGVAAASVFLSGTELQEESLKRLSYMIHCISLVAGGIASGRRSESKGWYHGGALGLLYCIVVLIIAFLAYDKGFSLQTLMLLGLTLLSGSIGGMIGVNLRRG